MKILCIETSSDACSVALNCKDTVVEYYELAPCKHSSLILPMIQNLLTEARVTFSQLDALAFGCGPGSFTGIRLATSIAQGLALGLELSVMPISTLNIMAQGVCEEYNARNVLVGVDAKMGGIYWGAYCLDANGLMQPLIADKLVSLQQNEQVFEDKNLQMLDWFGVGDVWEMHKELLQHQYKVIGVAENFYPRAKHLMPIAKENFKQGKVVSVDHALPVYLREQVVHN